jgi:HD superfamily phosphohydrolase
MKTLINYIESLQNNSFEGWNENVKTSYLLACALIKTKAEKIIESKVNKLIEEPKFKIGELVKIYSNSTNPIETKIISIEIDADDKYKYYFRDEDEKKWFLYDIDIQKID